MARIAIEPHNLRQVYPEYTIIDGSYADFERERVACLIGQDLAHVHNLKFAGRMTLVGDIFPRHDGVHGPCHLRFSRGQRVDVLQPCMTSA